MTPWIVLGVYSATSAIAVFTYARDKRSAVLGRRRIRERTLHLIEALGGWPGAVLARRWLRHKTRDSAFLFVSWLIIAGHAVCWCGWLWL